MKVGKPLDSLNFKNPALPFSEVLAEGSPRPLSSVPDVTHHLVASAVREAVAWCFLSDLL